MSPPTRSSSARRRSARKSASSPARSRAKREAVVPDVDVPSSSLTHVVVDDLTSRSDSDVPIGRGAHVVAGEHNGRAGVVVGVVETGADGYPETVTLHTRDARKERIVVKFADLQPAQIAGPQVG